MSSQKSKMIKYSKWAPASDTNIYVFFLKGMRSVSGSLILYAWLLLLTESMIDYNESHNLCLSYNYLMTDRTWQSVDEEHQEDNKNK